MKESDVDAAMAQLVRTRSVPAPIWADILAAKDARIAQLKADNAALVDALAERDNDLAKWKLRAQAFTADPTPADLPDPPRRPDGTLAPQTKPLKLPTDNTDRRRIGG